MEPDETPHWSEFHELDCPLLICGRALAQAQLRNPDSDADDALGVLIEDCFDDNGGAGEDYLSWCHYCNKGATWDKTKQRLVVIEVLGGVANISAKPKGVTVRILDWDDADECAEDADESEYTRSYGPEVEIKE